MKKSTVQPIEKKTNDLIVKQAGKSLDSYLILRQIKKIHDPVVKPAEKKSWPRRIYSARPRIQVDIGHSLARAYWYFESIMITVLTMESYGIEEIFGK